MSTMVSNRSETFLARVVELQLEDCIPELKTRGFTTYAKFAYGCEYNPQMADASILTTQLLKPVAKDDEDKLPGLRMLWWEAWGVATADMRRVAEGGGDAPRRLCAPELKARRGDVVSKLHGLTITPELDVSDQLITECVALADRNRLKYVSWESCTARQLEVTGVKTDPTWVKDPATGFLRCGAEEETGKAPCGTELELDFALKRRGLALAMADILAWEVHEALRQDLLSALMRQPPPGYDRVSMAQVRRADEVAFGLLAKAADAGIRRVGGDRPLDAKMDGVIAHRDYNLALQPLAARPGKRPIEEAGEWQQSARPSKRQRQANRAPGNGKGATSKGSFERPTGRGKGKDRSAPAVPLELRGPGMSTAEEDGTPLCYKFNISSCGDAPPGGKCRRGKHVCALTSCRKAHSYCANH